MSVVARSEAWQTRAACAGSDARAFFTVKPAAAKAVCSGCPVRPECLYDALDADAPNGIWGGLTRGERVALPDLPRHRAAALTALRELLDAHEPDEDLPTERTPPIMTTTEPTADANQLTTSALLRWAEDHWDPDVQGQGARTEAALTALHTRYAADQELANITSEAERLERRLAALRSRQAELAPVKPKRKPADYPAAEVRAWASANGIPCPATGRVPKAVVEAWRTASGTTSSSS